MNWKPAEKIADAVLYEGYLLYPYRASALKNQKRAMFGALEPGGATGLDCLLEGSAETRLSMKVRFLQDLSTTIEEKEFLVEDVPAGGRRDFTVPPVAGVLESRAEAPGLFVVGLRIESPSASLRSCHALLGVEGGTFVSSTDPRAAGCAHRGLWPVLVGSDLLLAAPILLPDHPEVAPESPRDLFDATEIDEILTLRILTLSEAEKEEIRRGDGRARRILEQTEALSREGLLALHGRAGLAFQAGDRVRIRPKGRADIMDLALEGKEATVVAVEEDLEGRRYLALTVADDPGCDLGEQGFLGHRFFFRPEEVERL